MLRRLKALGVTLVLDDFGTGYSSLAHVKRFPLDVLKIDRSFVKDLGEDGDDDAAIVEAIISMSRGIRVEAIAEGIETALHVERLSELGCKLGQGYHYARPLLGETLPAQIAAVA